MQRHQTAATQYLLPTKKLHVNPKGLIIQSPRRRKTQSLFLKGICERQLWYPLSILTGLLEGPRAPSPWGIEDAKRPMPSFDLQE